MSVDFTKKTWYDGSEGGTPITAAELNRVETGIDDVVTQSNADKTNIDTHLAKKVNSSDGAHGLRYYNSELDYYDDTNEEWVEIQTGGGGASSAEDVSYDNTDSGLTASNVQDAIDELADGSSSGDYEDLTNLPSINGVELLGNKAIGLLSGNIQVDSDKIGYNNAISGLSATNVKSAIDELANSPVAKTNIEAVYEETTALSAHSVNEYIYMNNLLYRVTSAISIGDSIVVDTNVELADDIEEGTEAYVSNMPGASGGSSGGGSGTGNYPDLTNKPRINGVELLGNKTVGLLSSNIQINSDKIGYNGLVSGASNVQTALNTLKTAIDNQSGSGQEIFWFDTELQTWFSDGNHNGFVINGNVVSNADWRYTDYIPVQYGDFVFGSLNNFGGNLPAYELYDANKSFILDYKQYPTNHKNSWGWNGVISNQNAAYIRVNFGCDIWEGIDTAFFGIIRNRNKNERIVLTLDSSQARSFYNSTNVFEAFNKAWAIGDCDLYIKGGTYDILTDCEFINSQGLSKNTIVGTGDFSENRACGLRVGRNNRYYGVGGKITLLNTGKYSGADYVVSLVSALHICGSCELHELFVEVTNCRYAVHEDLTAYMYPTELSEEGEGYVVKYNRCNMTHNGLTYSAASYTSNCVIGAGTYINSKSYVTGGVYNAPTDYPAISYHNNSSSSSDEYVFLEGVQTGRNANRLQFYGFVNDGSIIHAYVNGCWAPIPTRIVGIADRIDLNMTDFGRSVQNQYENATGGYYQGYPVYRYCTTKTASEIGLNDSGTYVEFYTFTGVTVLDVDAMLIVQDTNGNKTFFKPHGDGTNEGKLDVKVVYNNSTSIYSVQVALKDPSSYVSSNTTSVRVAVEYTKEQ